MATRKGLNCTLSYTAKVSGKTVNRSFQIRVDTIGHGLAMVSDESTGRNRRAYYPHRVAPAQFYIRPLLVGYAERKAFSDWMQGYANYVMDPGLPSGKKFPDINVLIPARKFDRDGVPLSGWEGGDNIGSMMWTPTVTFVTTRDPQDTETWAASSFVAAKDSDMKYFWPLGTQLGGDSVPSGNYTQISQTDTGSDYGQTPPPPPPPGSSFDTQSARDAYGN